MARACSAASMWAWRLPVRTASSSAARLGKRRYRVAMPTRAWRAICSSGPPGPGRRTPAGRLRRWPRGCAGRRGAMAVALGGRRSSWEQCTRNTEAYLRIVPDERSTGESPPFMEGVVTMTTNVETTGRDAVLVQDAAQIQMMGLPVLEALPARGCPTSGSTPSSWSTRAGSVSPSCRAWTPGIPTEASTTCGTSWRGRPAPATAPARAAPSSGRDCPRARSWRSGRGGAPGMPRGSAPRSVRRAWATPSGEACCSG